jgi:hypothetical protein
VSSEMVPKLQSPLCEHDVNPTTCIVCELEAARAKITELCAALADLLELPYVIDEATVPRAGIDAAPRQVIGTLHMSVERRRHLASLLEDKP